MEHQLETLKSCPVCGSVKLHKEFKTRDYFLSQEEFTLCKCQKCGFIFTNPRPAEDNLSRYYKSEDYISHSNSNKGIVAYLYQIIRRITLFKKYELVTTFRNSNRILDIGCATGQFLNEFKKRGWNCTGIEPDEDSREFARSNFDLKVFEPDNIGQLDDHTFDVITMWHVLEHVSDLDGTMKELQRLIKANGVLFIAVPNIESWDATHYGPYWAGLDVPRHLSHFSQKTLELLFNNYHFKLDKIVPMKFDSFYVSLLSEKYKKNPLYLFSAFFKGLYSNIRGINGKNYSSLIYIIKPKVV